MPARIVPMIERPITERGKRFPLEPHLVCMWEIDPASKRLSCVWAAPTPATRPNPAEHLRLVVG
jgi:hypothetical protein